MDIERRQQSDRRQRDIGPPHGWGERRQRAERRLPVAEESALSADDFARYFGIAVKAAAPVNSLVDEAAEILGRNAGRY